MNRNERIYKLDIALLEEKISALQTDIQHHKDVWASNYAPHMPGQVVVIPETCYSYAGAKGRVEECYPSNIYGHWEWVVFVHVLKADGTPSRRGRVSWKIKI